MTQHNHDCHHPNHRYHRHAYDQGDWGEGLDDRVRLNTTRQQGCIACFIFQPDGEFLFIG